MDTSKLLVSSPGLGLRLQQRRYRRQVAELLDGAVVGVDGELARVALARQHALERHEKRGSAPEGICSDNDRYYRQDTPTRRCPARGRTARCSSLPLVASASVLKRGVLSWRLEVATGDIRVILAWLTLCLVCRSRFFNGLALIRFENTKNLVIIHPDWLIFDTAIFVESVRYNSNNRAQTGNAPPRPAYRAAARKNPLRGLVQ